VAALGAYPQAGDSLSSSPSSLYARCAFSGLGKLDLGQAMSPLLGAGLLARRDSIRWDHLLIWGGFFRACWTAPQLWAAATSRINVAVGIPVVTWCLGQGFLVYLFAILVFHSLLGAIHCAKSVRPRFWAEGDRKGHLICVPVFRGTSPIHSLFWLLLGRTTQYVGLAGAGTALARVDGWQLPPCLCVTGIWGLRSVLIYRLHMSLSMGV